MERERTAALAGVLYVALDVVVGVMAGAPPSPDAPQGEIVAYIADHHAGLALGLWLFGLATIPLLWWFGSLWGLMVRAEAGAPRLAVISLCGLLLGGPRPWPRRSRWPRSRSYATTPKACPPSTPSRPYSCRLQDSGWRDLDDVSVRVLTLEMMIALKATPRPDAVGGAKDRADLEALR